MRIGSAVICSFVWSAQTLSSLANVINSSPERNHLVPKSLREESSGFPGMSHIKKIVADDCEGACATQRQFENECDETPDALFCRVARDVIEGSATLTDNDSRITTSGFVPDDTLSVLKNLDEVVLRILLMIAKTGGDPSATSALSHAAVAVLIPILQGLGYDSENIAHIAEKAAVAAVESSIDSVEDWTVFQDLQKGLSSLSNSVNIVVASVLALVLLAVYVVRNPDVLVSKSVRGTIHDLTANTQLSQDMHEKLKGILSTYQFNHYQVMAVYWSKQNPKTEAAIVSIVAAIVCQSYLPKSKQFIPWVALVGVAFVSAIIMRYISPSKSPNDRMRALNEDSRQLQESINSLIGLSNSNRDEIIPGSILDTAAFQQREVVETQPDEENPPLRLEPQLQKRILLLLVTAKNIKFFTDIKALKQTIKTHDATLGSQLDNMDDNDLRETVLHELIGLMKSLEFHTNLFRMMRGDARILMGVYSRFGYIAKALAVDSAQQIVVESGAIMNTLNNAIGLNKAENIL